MKIAVTVEAELTVEFDENSAEFQELYENYKKYISNSDYEEFASEICSHIARYGENELIEGIGYPKINGEKHIEYFAKGGPEEYDSPINIQGEFDLNGKVGFDCCARELTED